MGRRADRPHRRTSALESGTPVLAAAAEAGATELCRALLESGADPDAGGAGAPPLVRAATRGDAPTCRVLLDGGADPSKPDDYGDTPLIVAARAGVLAAVELLLERGADPRPASQRRLTARDESAGPDERRTRALIGAALAASKGKRRRPAAK